MTRNLKTLGLVLAAALALSAVVASVASAEPALFTANVLIGEPAEIHGEQQVGTTDTFTLFEKHPPITCVTAKETGFTEKEGKHTTGPSAPSVTLTPTYETCHIQLGPVTRTVTVTLNGCSYTLTATESTGGFASPFSADLTINCAEGKQIEIHVYNTSNHNDTGAATLCTYDIPSQQINDQIELTNISRTPDHILEHINATIQVHNTILSATCGTDTFLEAVYTGTHTVRATNGVNAFVSTTVS